MIDTGVTSARHPIHKKNDLRTESKSAAALPAGRLVTRSFRTDIQALRAIAVVLVVLTHLWPTRLPGGYVGVDVFFVISGFLITSHLVRELQSRGRVRLREFYARRARRLLPAALGVLAFSAIATFLFLPALGWERAAAEIASSAFYFENWYLAAEAVNYSAQNDAATAVQHYWSLSVEEQFYLFWPLLLIASFAVAKAAPKRVRLRVVGSALAIVGALSLAFSMWATNVAPQEAYFVTPTRIWEFVVGGLLAVTPLGLLARRSFAEAAAWIGLGMVVSSALLFNHATPFPGIAALLPTIGAALIIAAGSDQPQLSHAHLSNARPVQWLGDASYSIYLWHWPLIVVAPFVLQRGLTTLDKAGLIVVTLVLAGLSRRYLEGAAQQAPFLKNSPRRTFWLTGSAMGLVGVMAAGLFVTYGMQAKMSGAVSLDPPELVECLGPNALSQAGCDVSAPSREKEMGASNAYYNTPDNCSELLPLLSIGPDRTTRHCDFSAGMKNAPNVWLVGDSHAQQFQWPVFDLARKYQWDLTISFLGGCPLADVPFIGYRGDRSSAAVEKCERWSELAAAEILHAKPDLVFYSTFARAEDIAPAPGADAQDEWNQGLSAYWSQWASTGATVIVLGDPPLNGEVRDPKCASLYADSPARCAIARAQAQPPDPMLIAAQQLNLPGVKPVDLTNSFCDALCHAVVGGVPVYFDADHLNVEYARMLAPVIELALPQHLASAG